MIVHRNKNDGPLHEGIPPEISLHPENDRDRELLEQIERDYVTLGMGRHPDTMGIQHVRIALQEKPDE